MLSCWVGGLFFGFVVLFFFLPDKSKFSHSTS